MKSVRTLDSMLRKSFRDCLEIKKSVRDVLGTSETCLGYLRVYYHSTKDVSRECLQSPIYPGSGETRVVFIEGVSRSVGALGVYPSSEILAEVGWDGWDKG
ncbi:UNVERIFIED_CONTAM: hypothetical protein Sradi_5696700 [Sesamum radiatum]|uniref:Uncharacterized protein n=1 Tax=Sesamum radiatum TaxID=300843 RepID=A0AAW2L0R8_SESRA